MSNAAVRGMYAATVYDAPTTKCAQRRTNPMTTATSTASERVQFFYREITGRFKVFISSAAGTEQIATADSRAYAELIVVALRRNEDRPRDDEQQPAT